MDLVDFPPFYTLQPVLATREKQLEKWREVVLKAAGGSSTAVVDLSTFPAFSNARIDRSLDLEGRRAVGDAMVESGHGEWEDPAARTRLRVFTRTPEAWAAVVYAWARETGRVGQGISTFYEIHSGEDAEGTELAGLHEDVLLRALKILEQQGKAQTFSGPTMDEMGVKFL